MNKPNDTDLREALRRREARRPRVEVPDDFLSNVMQKTEAQQHPQRQDASGHHRPWRIALAALAAAASIALVVMLTRPVTQSVSNIHSTHAQLSSNSRTTFTRLTRNFMQTHAQLSTNSRATFTQSSALSQSKVQRLSDKSPRTSGQKSTDFCTDNLDDYVAKMESDLADVRDSCYLAQVERMIADNEELQRLINEMTNHKQ